MYNNFDKTLIQKKFGYFIKLNKESYIKILYKYNKKFVKKVDDTGKVQLLGFAGYFRNKYFLFIT